MTFEQGIMTAFGIGFGILFVAEGLRRGASRPQQRRPARQYGRIPVQAPRPQEAQEGSQAPAQAVLYPRRLVIEGVEYPLAAEDWWAVLEALPKLNPGSTLAVKLPGAGWLAGKEPPEELAGAVRLIQDLAASRGVRLTE